MKALITIGGDPPVFLLMQPTPLLSKLCEEEDVPKLIWRKRRERRETRRIASDGQKMMT